jgi:hypothetical protein
MASPKNVAWQSLAKLRSALAVSAAHYLFLQACCIISFSLHFWSLVKIAESNSFLYAAVTFKYRDECNYRDNIFQIL